MRLRASITPKLLADLIALLKFYPKDEFVICFAQDKFSFCVVQGAFGGIWVECDLDKVFQGYDVSSKYDNKMLLRMDSAALASALASDEKNNPIKLKLAPGKNGAFLQFIHSPLDKSKILRHNVQINFLKTQMINSYAEPDYQATMAACLPPLSSLKLWCANAVNISKNVTISIIRNSETEETEVVFHVESESHLVSISTHYHHMEIPNSSADETLFDSDNTQCEVTVDLKRFNKILKVDSLRPQSSQLFIKDKTSLRVSFDVEYATIAQHLAGITS